MSTAVLSNIAAIAGVDKPASADHAPAHGRPLDHEPPPHSDAVPRNPPETPSLTTTRFSRRVSFNNLHPEWADHEQPSWSPLYTQNNNYNYATNPTFGYGNSTVNDISKAYSQSQPVKKKLKLPDPPSRSILKNKVSSQQLEYNAKSQDDDDEEDFTSNNLSLTGSSRTPASESLMVPTSPPASRRKSYSEMTDEELMALDPQFKTTKAKTSNMDQFKFDSQKTYYLPSKRPSTSTIGSQPAPRSLMYPSSNENNYKSISLTVKHNQFDQFPYNRTILTVLSGRRHTWNSVDWLLLTTESLDDSLTSILQDGDYLVVSALIPLKFLTEFRKKAKKSCSLDDYLYKKGENLLNYIINNELLKKNNLRLKITVELVTDNDLSRSGSFSGASGSLGSSVSSSATASGHQINPNLTGTKYMLQHLFKQYQPSIVVMGNKSSNLNFKYPLKIKKQNQKDEYLIKLSSYVVKYSPVPVILVGNGTKFHNKTGREAMLRSAQSPPPQSLKFNLDEPRCPRSRKSSKPEIVISPTAGSPIDEGSSGSRHRSSSCASSSGSIESTESYTGPENEFYDQIINLGNSQAESKFQDMITLISDKSLGDSRYYLDALNSKDDSLKLDTKIHSIYRSQTTGHSAGFTTSTGVGFGGNGTNSLYREASVDSSSHDVNSSSDRIYKVRSLISYNEDKEHTNHKLRNDLKRRRNRGSVSSKSTMGSEKKDAKENKGKRSIWQKLGLKK